VTDVGGRGDQSFNDGALRGLESWACGLRYTASGYQPLSDAELAATIPSDLHDKLVSLQHVQGLAPYVLQARAQEDYRPDLELLAQRHSALAVGVGFMLEDAVAAEARTHPEQRYLLIDSPILDAKGAAVTLPNVESVTFREQEGSYLAGALAGLATKTGQVAFVGGMQVPLIQRFEAGFRAGVAATNPAAAAKLAVQYTGSFDDSSAGKRVAQSLYGGGVDVLFQAAGADGLGAIEAAKEAGKLVIGVDSDQAHLAPASVLTSMVKHVDYAVYMAVRDIAADHFTPGNRELGLLEGGVGLAPVLLDFPGKAAALKTVEELRQKIMAGQIHVPRTPAEIAPTAH
jgi:basic membrane protein A